MATQKFRNEIYWSLVFSVCFTCDQYHTLTKQVTVLEQEIRNRGNTTVSIIIEQITIVSIITEQITTLSIIIEQTELNRHK